MVLVIIYNKQEDVHQRIDSLGNNDFGTVKNSILKFGLLESFHV
jgi:hypothetical protein